MCSPQIIRTIPTVKIVCLTYLQLVFQSFIFYSNSCPIIKMQGGPLNRRASFSCFLYSFSSFPFLSPKQRPPGKRSLFFLRSPLRFADYISQGNRLFHEFTTCFLILHKIFINIFYHKNARRTAEPPSLLFLFLYSFFSPLLFSLQKQRPQEAAVVFCLSYFKNFLRFGQSFVLKFFLIFPTIHNLFSKPS